MGRYDRDSKRYSRSKGKQANGIPAWLTIILMLTGIAAGFFLRPVADSLVDPLTHLAELAIAPKTAHPDIAATPPPLTPSPVPANANPELEPTSPPPAPIILPTLDSSDNQFRTQTLTAAPELAPWLVGDNLIRKFMLLANDLSQSQRTNKHLDFLKLSQPFSVNSSGTLIAPASYQRYKPFVSAIDQLDADAVLRVYQTFKPLGQQVLAELGYPDDYTVDALLSKAATAILNAPIIEGDISVVKHSIYYHYTDPQLEAMNPVNKQMLRMGPENTRIIQTKVAALLAKLHGGGR
ncbi:DUF3014 domain-containing protein [Methylovulum psychrotolerans]|uniref:DUF3014 domain-containing protein n=1 Tax=Methylovulum psychrotolerans TaxID=1704499 RepID=UPI001BFFC121|nr:DUF3014 domain-containing protein [Methylovulum psychrotolerans]MBT9098384.1 DUF3014 domain-containing protein [Methylovulum psychrotolerans]